MIVWMAPVGEMRSVPPSRWIDAAISALIVSSTGVASDVAATISQISAA